MAGDMKAITTKTKNMDLEYTNGWMEGSMRACGWMGNNMARESIFCLMDPSKLGDGLMGKEWNGLKMSLRLILFKRLKSWKLLPDKGSWKTIAMGKKNKCSLFFFLIFHFLKSVKFINQSHFMFIFSA